MAYLKQALEPTEVKSMTVAKIKKEYNSLATDYNKLINLDYIYCPICGQFKSAENSFYHSKKSISGYAHCGCKQCLLNEATDLVDKKTNERVDNRDKTIAVFRKLDLPFIEDVYRSQLNLIKEEGGSRRGTAYSQLLTLVSSLPQYQNKSFKDSEFGISDLENNTEENKKIVQKTVKMAKKVFGGGYTDEEYNFLGEELNDWKSRYECNTKAQEEVFENLALIKLLKKRALLEGKPTKDLDKQQQDWLDAGNLKPKQNSTDAFSDAQTFGTLIQKYEETRPLPEIDPELEDIDKIGLYIDTFYRGHASKMLGLKNRFSNLYEKVMSKYTVTPPEYDGESDSEVLFEKIFGSVED